MTNHSLGHAIALQREIRGFTQSYLAELSGVSKNGIAQIERGRFDPSVQSVRKIAGAFGIRDWQLLQFADGLQQLFDAPYDSADAVLSAAEMRPQ